MCTQLQDATYTPKKVGKDQILRYLQSHSRMLHHVVTFQPKTDSGGSRSFNDDYFPLGEEYEDELGPGWSDKVERIPARKSTERLSNLSQNDEEHDYFSTNSSLVSEERKIIFRDALEELEKKQVVDLPVRNMSDNEAYEKLEALQKKVEEFKQKLFRLRGEVPGTKQVESDSTTQEAENSGSKSSDSTGEKNCAEPEIDFFSSSAQSGESRKHGGGSTNRLITREEFGRSNETGKDRSLLSPLVPGRDIPRRCYGDCGRGPKNPKKPSQPNCPPPKKTPDCPSPSTPSSKPCPPPKKTPDCPPPKKTPDCPPPKKTPDCPLPKKTPDCPPPSKPPTQPCPPSKKTPDCSTPSKSPVQPCPTSKVKFRECPPPPKLPKLPKCPPPCAPPKPPPIPKCPTPPKCPPHPPPCAPPQNSSKCPESSPSLPPKQKCSGRKMSTYSLVRNDFKFASSYGTVASRSLSQRYPVFLVTRRRISSSSASFASKCNSKNSNNQSSKGCKKGKETGKNCSSKKSAKDRCAKLKKATKDCRKPKTAEKCSTECAPKPRCPPPSLPPPLQSKIKWSPPICSAPKLVGPSACPESVKPKSGHSEPLRSTCPPPPPLPKPPCRPVCLCPCPPPPKIPPGSCPEVPSVEERSDPSCPPPCPPKVPAPCPEDTWCPSKPICPPKK